MILKKRREILKVLSGELIEGVKKSPELKSSLGNDPGDISTLNENTDLSSSIADQYAHMLRDVDRSLGKVEDGTYGICEECGEEIDRRRLEAVPSASHCIQCQRAKEASLHP